MKICITSVGTATAIGLIKNIRKYDSNIKIIGTDINKYGYTAGSLLVDYYQQVSMANSKNYISEIVDLVNKEKVDLLIPVNDAEIEVISSYKNLLDDVCRCIIPDIDIVHLVRDKLLCTNKMLECGIKCPQLVTTDSCSKCIIRDRVGVGSKGVDVKPLGVLIKDVREEQFVQTFIDGDEFTVDVLCNENGIPLLIIPRRRIEVKAGVATKTRVELNNKMIEAVKIILKNIKLSGFSNIQFIKDINDEIWFIEINPRIGGCTSASMLAAPKMFEFFMDIVKNKIADEVDFDSNMSEVKWNSVITRYYEEEIYEEH